MQKILLVSPDFNPQENRTRFLEGSRLKALTFSSMKVVMVPLGLATIAALTPDEFEVDIWDEGVRGQIDDDTELTKDYVLVGVTGYSAHMHRVKEIGQIVRKRGIPVVVGGPGVSAAPEYYRNSFDILFIGEAEYTWPRFIAEWKAGKYRSEYRQVGKVDMANSPPPRWGSVSADMDYYLTGGVQTTRGCPFDCEFCDVIYIYGREARHKSIEQVLDEVRTQEQIGVRTVFFCDDNFIGNPRYAKSLLRELISLNQSFRRPMAFYTQITLNVAKDDEMLELLADANFSGLYIGIETPNIDSLVETNKPQNYKTDIVADVRKIHSYGLPVQAGMIVGFDHDDKTIFQHQLEFLREAGIPNPQVNALKAPTGTKLWVRLHKEGRLVEVPDAPFAVYSLTNILPKQMTRAELMEGYRDLFRRLRKWSEFEVRLKAMISVVRRRPNIKHRGRSWKMSLKFSSFVLFSMDREARWSTLRLLLYTILKAPFMMEKVATMITYQYLLAAQVPSVQERVDQQIRFETAEGMELQPERVALFVPDAFRKPYRGIFPDLYGRVYHGLTDKSQTVDALVEVTFDFLTRRGATFERFDEHDLILFHDISDRAVAKANSEARNSAREGVGADVEVYNEVAGLGDGHAGIKLKRLADDVLHAVEQDMRSHGRSPELFGRSLGKDTATQAHPTSLNQGPKH